MCTNVHVYTFACTVMGTRKSGSILGVLSFYHVGSEQGTWVLGFGGGYF